MCITYRVLADIDGHMTVAFYMYGKLFEIVAGDVDAVTEQIKTVISSEGV